MEKRERRSWGRERRGEEGRKIVCVILSHKFCSIL